MNRKQIETLKNITNQTNSLIKSFNPEQILDKKSQDYCYWLKLNQIRDLMDTISKSAEDQLESWTFYLKSNKGREIKEVFDTKEELIDFIKKLK